VELTLAYDATIEGWSHALDLRDKETEGHTQRVADLTLRLAQVMGVGDHELIHIRRGALLHDIGKMGITDEILRKPASLDEPEWVVMRQHPLYAYDMLSPISYLRPALDIPYCHHEKWDGSGYPRGLAREQIPLAARLFAVVDVYDALTSDRPYRKAWSHKKALEYVQQQAGQHFDPEIVSAFLGMPALHESWNGDKISQT
jgi:putative nucleotidyltransferase with HDIG domain